MFLLGLAILDVETQFILRATLLQTSQRFLLFNRECDVANLGFDLSQIHFVVGDEALAFEISRQQNVLQVLVAPRLGDLEFLQILKVKFLDFLFAMQMCDTPRFGEFEGLFLPSRSLLCDFGPLRLCQPPSNHEAFELKSAIGERASEHLARLGFQTLEQGLVAPQSGRGELSDFGDQNLCHDFIAKESGNVPGSERTLSFQECEQRDHTIERIRQIQIHGQPDVAAGLNHLPIGTERDDRDSGELLTTRGGARLLSPDIFPRGPSERRRALHKIEGLRRAAGTGRDTTDRASRYRCGLRSRLAEKQRHVEGSKIDEVNRKIRARAEPRLHFVEDASDLDAALGKNFARHTLTHDNRRFIRANNHLLAEKPGDVGGFQTGGHSFSLIDAPVRGHECLRCEPHTKCEA